MDGNLSNKAAVTDESGVTTFSYDDAGRVFDYSVTPRGYSTPYTFHKTYDDLGRITGITYPDNEGQGGTVRYAYQGANLYSITEGSTEYAFFTNYTALGQARHIRYGDWTSTDLAYYEQTTSRLQRITTVTPNDGTVLDLSYDFYDAGGNVLGITDHVHSEQGQGFLYDGMNRLKTAIGPYGRIDYTYDGAGNILSKTTSGGNRTDQQVTYSANKASGYDNRASAIDGADFTYDYRGERTSKSSGPLTTLHIGGLYEVTGGVGAKHIFAEGSRIASKGATGFYFYHTDHLGSLRVASRAGDAAVVQAVSYYPFGEIFSNQGINGGPPLVDLAYKFTGREYDPETGLYYFGARYYDPAIGRFLTPDSIVQNPADPQSLNRFAYARNNPLLYTDPTGHFWEFVFFALFGGAALGATFAAINGQDPAMGAAMGAIAGLGFAGAHFLTAGMDLADAAMVHAGMGAATGAINAAIGGGDIGLGALTGGVSGGVSRYVGGMLPGGFGEQLGGRMLTGAVSGGITAKIVGGDFTKGMFNGAWTAGFATIFNDSLNGAANFISRMTAGDTGGKASFYDEAPKGGSVAGDVVKIFAVTIGAPLTVSAGTLLAGEALLYIVPITTTFGLSYAPQLNQIGLNTLDFANGYFPGTPPPSAAGYAGFVYGNFLV